MGVWLTSIRRLYIAHGVADNYFGERRDHVEPDARKLLVRLRLELDRLTEAVNRAGGVVAEARALLQGTDETATLLRVCSAESDGDIQDSCDAGPAPRWDPRTRTLFVGRRIVKQFRVPSQNQETVLNAFQEEGWPRRIDDPLPCRGGLNAKYRLHFTLARLNRCGTEPLIRFFGDGTGKGICWEFSNAAAGSPAAEGLSDKRHAA